MSIAHANISVFVPNLGCKHACSFCNQVHITGTHSLPDENTITAAVNTAKTSKNYNPKTTELAFFGGSFTAIEETYMLSLLKVGKSFIDSGDISGIRVSTRPDAINDKVLEVLKNHGVTSIELGAQSLDDEVLTLNKRGHKAEDVVAASKLIKSYGFSLGLQMMTGLFGDTDEKALKTAESIISLSPDTVRIYPTIVLKNTYLQKLYEQGVYTPQTVEEAAVLCAKLVPSFKKHNIKVIRLGLHSIESESYVAGPWHSAFGEIVESKIYLEKLKEELKIHPKGDYLVTVPLSEVSKIIGQKRANIIALSKLGYNIKVQGNKHKNGIEIGELKCC